MAGKGSKVKFSKRDDDKCKDEICKDCGIIIERTTKALSCNFCHKWVCTIVLFTPHVPVFFWPNKHKFGDIELKFCILP